MLQRTVLLYDSVTVQQKRTYAVVKKKFSTCFKQLLYISSVIHFLLCYKYSLYYIKINKQSCHQQKLTSTAKKECHVHIYQFL